MQLYRAPPEQELPSQFYTVPTVVEPPSDFYSVPGANSPPSASFFPEATDSSARPGSAGSQLQQGGSSQPAAVNKRVDRVHGSGGLLQGIIPIIVLQQLQRYALLEHMDRLTGAWILEDAKPPLQPMEVSLDRSG